MSATPVLLTRRPAVRVAAPNVEGGRVGTHFSGLVLSAKGVINYSWTTEPFREPLSGQRGHILPERSVSAAGRIKLSACNHSDRIINWSGSALSAKPESMLVWP